MLPPSQFSYHRGLGTFDALLTLFHHLQVALDRGMKGRLVKLDFSAAFDRVSPGGQPYKLRSIGVGQFLSIASEFLCERMQREHLNRKVPQGRVLVSLLFILYRAPSPIGSLALSHCWEPYCGLCVWLKILPQKKKNVFYSFLLN